MYFQVLVCYAMCNCCPTVNLCQDGDGGIFYTGREEVKCTSAEMVVDSRTTTADRSTCRWCFFQSFCTSDGDCVV